MCGGIYEPKRLPPLPKTPVYMVVTPCGNGPYQICGRFYARGDDDNRIFAALEAGAIQLDGGYPCESCGPQRAVKVIRMPLDPVKVEVLFEDSDFYDRCHAPYRRPNGPQKPLGLIWP